MTSNPQISMDLFKTYFKHGLVEHNGKRIELKVSPSGNRFAFYISLKISEPGEEGSYPQQHLSLERHFPGAGHHGVHLQIKYHKSKNSMGIGKMWIILEVVDEENLKDTTEGFIFTLREIIRSYGEGFEEEVCSKLFYTDSIDELSDKKSVFIEHVRTGISERTVEVRKLDGTLINVGPEDIEELISTRKELVPLFGPIVINND